MAEAMESGDPAASEVCDEGDNNLMASALVVAACLVAAWSLGAWRGTSTMAAADVDAPPIKGIATDPDAESARSVRLSESRGRADHV